MTLRLAEVPRHKFTVDDYYKMAEAGILGEDDRVELIDGEILEMTPIGWRHAHRVRRFTRIFAERFAHIAVVDAQNPLHLSDRNEPQPDVVLLRFRPDDYATGHPTADDVLLVVEIADSSAGIDRTTKARLYARYGLPEYWLHDIAADSIIVHREPRPGGYGSVRTFQRGESIAPLTFPDVTITVADLLG